MNFGLVKESFDRLPAFGLDFSDRSIKIAQFHRHEGRLKLKSYGKREIPDGIVVGGEVKNGAALVREIKESMSKAKLSPVTTKEVVLSLPESKCFIKVIKTPSLSDDEIGETIRFKAEEYFPLAADEMSLDWYRLNTPECPTGVNGACSEILVAVASKVLVDSYLEIIDSAGLVPVVFEAESVATARALLKNQSDPRSVLIIDLGRDRTSFIFYKYPALRFTQSIPVSGDSFTLAIAKGMKISFEKAEKLKNETGLSRDTKDGEKVFESLVPQMEDLIVNIKKSINYYNDFFNIAAGKFSFRIIICGGGANLRSIDSYLSLRLRANVELADPWKGIYGRKVYTEEYKKIHSISYAESLFHTTALGLALYNA
jgi:type IV pilus assembly protein PilM